MICWPQADIDPGKIRGENKDNAAGTQPRKSCDPLRESICLKHVSHRNEGDVNRQEGMDCSRQGSPDVMESLLSWPGMGRDRLIPSASTVGSSPSSIVCRYVSLPGNDLPARPS